MTVHHYWTDWTSSSVSPENCKNIQFWKKKKQCINAFAKTIKCYDEMRYAGCFAGDSVGDLFKIIATLHQHGWQSSNIPSYLLCVLLGYHLLFKRTMTPDKGCLDEGWSAASVDLASTSLDLSVVEMVWEEMDHRRRQKGQQVQQQRECQRVSTFWPVVC